MPPPLQTLACSTSPAGTVMPSPRDRPEALRLNARPLPADGPATERERSRVADELGAHFANDDLTIEEYERRVEVVLRASTAAELNEQLADLPYLAPAKHESEFPDQPIVGDRRDAPARSVIAAIMGGAERKGSWRVPSELKVWAVMGGVDLDLRRAVLSEGVTEIEVFAMMGGVDIKVPPGVRVELMGIALMGGFESDAEDEPLGSEGGPVIRISGLAVMGGVGAHVVRPGKRALAKAIKILQRTKKRLAEP